MMCEQIEAEVGTEDVVAQIAGGAGLVKGLFEALVDLEDLAVDVVVTELGTHRIAGDDHAFDGRMRIVA